MQSDPGSGMPHAGDNDEEVWRDLVARFSEPDDAFMFDGGSEQEPSVQDTSGPKGVVDFDPLGVWRQDPVAAPKEAAAADRISGPPAAPGPRDYLVDDDEEEFVPEEPPSLRSSDPAIVLSWVGAAGGPLFLVFASIFWRSIPLLLVIGAIIAFLAGTVYLLSRLPNHRDHSDGDGAVV